MGEVYRADDLKLGQPVALKFLPKALASDPVRRERSSRKCGSRVNWPIRISIQKHETIAIRFFMPTLLEIGLTAVAYFCRVESGVRKGFDQARLDLGTDSDSASESGRSTIEAPIIRQGSQSTALRLSPGIRRKNTLEFGVCPTFPGERNETAQESHPIQRTDSDRLGVSIRAEPAGCTIEGCPKGGPDI